MVFLATGTLIAFLTNRGLEMAEEIRIFSGTANPELAASVARELGVGLADSTVPVTWR